MPFTPGLDRLDAMQKAPLGTFSLLRRPSPVASQYKRQSEMYGQALRTLSRAARRGNAEAALKAIDVGTHAMENGFSPRGISRAEDFRGNVSEFEQGWVGKQKAMAEANTLDRENVRTSLNPNATVGAGRGRPLSRAGGFGDGPDMVNTPKSSWESEADNGKWIDISGKSPAPTPAKTLSFEEQDRLAKERPRASGAFGTLSRRRSPLGY